MKVTDYNDRYYNVVPESPTERGILTRIPAFLRGSRQFLMPKNPTVIQNIIPRLKRDFKKPIGCPQSLVDHMNTEVVLSDIPEDFPWLSKPYPHQELALRYLYTHGSGGLLLEPGLGKTYVVLNFIKLMGFKKSIIICPKALCFVWEDEVTKHRPDLRLHVMKSVTWERRIARAEERVAAAEEALPDEGHPDFKKARAKLMSAKRDVKNFTTSLQEDTIMADRADILVINYEKAHPGVDWAISKNFDFIAIDEGLIKDTSTNRTKAITKIANKIDHRVIMSGTLINNSALDAFSPIRFIEPSLVSTAYGRFEHYYGNLAQLRNGQSFVTGVSGRNVGYIRDILRSCSIVMTKDEWLPDLPTKNFHPVDVPMSDEQRDLYNDLQSNYLCKVGDSTIQADNPLTMACKLNQICNGFIYTTEDEFDISSLWGNAEETSDVRVTTPIPCRKREYLKNLLRGPCHSKKLILWYNMTGEYDQIVDVLNELDVEFSTIKGGTKNSGNVVRDFNESGTTQVLVCQAQAVNYGITVLGTDPEKLESNVEVLPDFDTLCHTQIFWSISWSLERFLQQQDRIHRIGQIKPCDYYILLTEDSVERGIWDRLSTKKAINEAVLVDIINCLKDES